METTPHAPQKRNLHRISKMKDIYQSEYVMWLPKKSEFNKMLLKVVSKPVFFKLVLKQQTFFLLTQTHAEYQYKIHSSVPPEVPPRNS